jgi:hypothetical protein
MSSERMRKFRENLKRPENKDKLDDYRKKQRICDKNYRENQVIENEDNHRLIRNEARKKVYDEHARKAFNDLHNLIDNDQGYTSSQGLAFAVKKTENSLPVGKKRCIEIIKVIAQKLGLKIVEENENDNNMRMEKRSRRNFFLPTIEKVNEFFYSDIISRALPGKNDYLTITNDDGEKEKIQKRFMQMSVHQAYEQFKETYPDVQISESKFHILRPQNILIMSKVPNEYCLCSYCENMSFVFDALKSHTVPSIKSFEDFLSQFSCGAGYLCASNQCHDCADFSNKIEKIISLENLDKSIILRKWMKIGSFVQKVSLMDKTVRCAMDEFCETFQFYKIHKHLIKTQSEFIYELKKHQPNNDVTLIMDYSQNFTTTSHREVQSAFFTRRQISIFTAVAYVGQQAPISFAIVNDDTKHAKEQVWFYSKIIIEHLKQINPNISHIAFVTDGCASQFKNKDSIASLLYTREDFGVTAEWHFTPTSHGKSAADGIGGNVKRQVHLQVTSGNYEVNDASQFVACAKSVLSQTNVIYASENQIKPFLAMLRARWRKTKMIPGTRSYHFFAPVYPNKISAAVDSHGDDKYDYDVQ